MDIGAVDVAIDVLPERVVVGGDEVVLLELVPESNPERYSGRVPRLWPERG